MPMTRLTSGRGAALRRLAREDHEILKAAEILAEQAGLLPPGLKARRDALRQVLKSATTRLEETTP